MRVARSIRIVPQDRLCDIASLFFREACKVLASDANKNMSKNHDDHYKSIDD